MRLNRRKFLQVSAGVATAMALTSKKVGAQLKPVVTVGNPLDTYTDRRWEEVSAISINMSGLSPIAVRLMILTCVEFADSSVTAS